MEAGLMVGRITHLPRGGGGTVVCKVNLSNKGEDFEDYYDGKDGIRIPSVQWRGLFTLSKVKEGGGGIFVRLKFDTAGKIEG